MPASSRLPELGRRGEGWVALQLLLLAATVASGLTGVYWPNGAEGVLAVFGLVVGAFGLALLLVAGLSLGASLTVLPKPREPGGLVQSGVYRVVRHPVYGAVLLLALAWSLAESPLGLIPSALLALVFDLKARLEEAWLQERHPEYAGYQERTPRRFIPGVY
jgi:protein-S-isoprenylcysteine O-methyltransferase Ste14